MERGEHERVRLTRQGRKHRSTEILNPPLSESVLRFFVRLLDLLRCSHPVPVIVITTISGFLALLAGRGIGTFWVVGAVLTGQLFVGWTNDYLDRDHDLHAARIDKPVVTGKVKAATVARAALLALLFCVPLSLASSLAAALVHLVAISLATL
jgi:4-hydroxybenzoate polyprenyltransferase